MDLGLNEKSYIVPGLGDAGDRLYGDQTQSGLHAGKLHETSASRLRLSVRVRLTSEFGSDNGVIQGQTWPNPHRKAQIPAGAPAWEPTNDRVETKSGGSSRQPLPHYCYRLEGWDY